ncbi:hypothetical protein KGP93_26815 [Burkholderia multivorans]|nr:hypothetical protein [Burkholderia multivorans]
MLAGVHPPANIAKKLPPSAEIRVASPLPIPAYRPTEEGDAACRSTTSRRPGNRLATIWIDAPGTGFT